MIEVKYDGRKGCEISIDSTRKDIPAEMIALMHELWNSVNEKDSDLGKQIKDFLTEHVEALFMNEDELDAWIEKEIPSEKLRALKALQAIDEILGNILKSIDDSDEDKDDED